ncbi:MAG: YkgJ family cysteine cluster protein [Candidatus Gastranaerophilales bacterium]|nr:YkgJ family cysteine cluster protein [Candidatus Gastranaerophilales bacterium]
MPKKARFKLEGNCLKCGDCCRYMYSVDTYTEDEFRLMTKLFPKYKRFQIIGRDEYDNLIFACNLIDKNGLCSDYKNRLKMCKNYPSAKVNNGGVLHKRCGYKISPEKSFKDYLK